MTPITEASLNRKLNKIRASISAIKRRDISNVVFLNIDGFARFVDDTLGRGSKLGSALTEVEPYIPLILSDENLKVFLDAAANEDASLVAQLERAFLNDAKARFINSVYNAEDEAAWNEIAKTCETIRSYRAKA